MERMPWVWYAWPGLARIRRDGDALGLLTALAFAVLLNLALTTALIWTEVEPFSGPGRIFLWAAVGIYWSAAAGYDSIRVRYYNRPKRVQETEDLYQKGLTFYLQRSWYDAEVVLKKLIRRNAKDVDARLLMVSLLRRTDRLDEATEMLDRLALTDGAKKWEFELDQQRRFLAEAIREKQEKEKLPMRNPSDHLDKADTEEPAETHPEELVLTEVKPARFLPLSEVIATRNGEGMSGLDQDPYNIKVQGDGPRETGPLSTDRGAEPVPDHSSGTSAVSGPCGLFEFRPTESLEEDESAECQTDQTDLESKDEKRSAA